MSGSGLVREQSIEDTPARSATGIRQPAVLVPVWWLLGSLCAVEALHELTGVGGPDAVFGIGMEAFLVSAAAVICLTRAFYEPRGRAPWLWIGAGLACWAVGTVLWDIVYSPDTDPPYPSIADAFWLAWYPLTVFGLVLLVKERVRGFELHRWMDGVALVLVVLTPAVAVIVQPVADRSTEGG